MKNTTKIITCNDVNGKKSKTTIDKLQFRPSVYGLLIENDKILLSRQWDGYDFPGGGIEIDETIEEALKREFFEETGMKIEPVIPIHCETDFFNPDYTKKYKGQFWNCIMIYFIVKKIGGKLSKDNLCDTELEYADMPEWMNLKEIYNNKFFNSVDSVKLIEKAVKMLE
jgi:8-oxo-dGTP pyrophosphatase MutT (NUDIX family)